MHQGYFQILHNVRILKGLKCMLILMAHQLLLVMLLSLCGEVWFITSRSNKISGQNAVA